MLLSVEVQVNTGFFENGIPWWFATCPQVSEKIEHDDGPHKCRVSEGKFAYCAQVLLELRRDARAKSVVAAVVRARGDFVYQQVPIARDEELDCHHPDVPEGGGDVRAQGPRVLRQFRRDPGGDPGGVQDVVTMEVLGDRVEAHVSGDVSRQENRDFLLKVDERLNDGRLPCERVP